MKRNEAQLLKHLLKAPLVACQHQVGGYVNQMVMVGSIAERRGVQQGPKLRGRHSRWPEVAHQILHLSGAPQFSKNKDYCLSRGLHSSSVENSLESKSDPRRIGSEQGFQVFISEKEK
jgi:hypothetical protein